MSEELMGVIPEKDLDTLRMLMAKAIDENSHFRMDQRADGLILKISVFPRASEGANKNATLIGTLIGSADNKALEKTAFAEIVLSSEGALNIVPIEQALRKVLSDLYKQVVGTSVDNSVSLTKLEEAAQGKAVDAQELANTIGLIAKQKDKAALPLLIKLLSITDNLNIGNACLMALGELKDPRAMQAIIDFAEHKPALLRRQAIIAARQIGSKLAAEWLLVMAYGHDDPLVRKEAAEALAEVESHLEGQH